MGYGLLRRYNLDSAKKKKKETERYNLDFNLLYFIFRINFSYKVDYSLRLQLYLVKKILLHILKI